MSEHVLTSRGRGQVHGHGLQIYNIYVYICNPRPITHIYSIGNSCRVMNIRDPRPTAYI